MTTLSGGLSPQFDSLTDDQRRRILDNYLKNPNVSGGLPTFAMRIPSGDTVNGSVFADAGAGRGVINPDDAIPADDTGGSSDDGSSAGALSQTANVTSSQPDYSLDPSQKLPNSDGGGEGALSQPGVARPSVRQPIDIAAMLQKFVPQDDSRSRYMALAAGFGATTKTGSFGESLGNVANAMQQQKAEQDKIRAQYVPLIMQQVAAQQSREEQAGYRADAALQAQQARADAATQAQAAAAQRASDHNDTISAIAGGAQAVRSNAVAVSKAKLYEEAKAKNPFGIPPDVLAQINAIPGGSGQVTNFMPTGPGIPSNLPAGTSLIGPGSVTDGLTGDDFLTNLPKPMADQVKLYADGHLSFPTGNAGNSPYIQGMKQAVIQYDPTFDQTDYNKRAKTATGFAIGKQGDNVKTANQLMGHVGSLANDIDDLNNFNFPLTPLNSIVNPLEEATGLTSSQNNFRTTARAMSSELRKLFAGTGGGSVSELRSWESSFPENASHSQQVDYLKNGVDLARSSISSLAGQYSAGMGKSADNTSLLTPYSQAVMSYIEGSGPKPPRPTGNDLANLNPVATAYKGIRTPATTPGVGGVNAIPGNGTVSGLPPDVAAALAKHGAL